MERYYRIAGLCLRIQGADGEMYTDDGILSEYRTDPGPVDHSLDCRHCDALPEPEGEPIFLDPGMRVYGSEADMMTYFGSLAQSVEPAYMAVHRTGPESKLWLRKDDRNRIYPKTVLRALGLEHLLTRHDGMLFHSTFIDAGGKAILFTAPSGVGKSTQAALWCQHRDARLINGDRSAIRCMDGKVYACGVPFSGSSDVRHNECLPLAAIVCLSQAPHNTVDRLKGVRAFRQIWEGCSIHTWERGDMEKATRTVMQVLQQVPVYTLACTPDASAVEVLHQQLMKEKVL